MQESAAKTLLQGISEAYRLDATMWGLSPNVVDGALGGLRIVKHGVDHFVYWAPQGEDINSVYAVDLSRHWHSQAADLIFRQTAPSNYFALSDKLHAVCQMGKTDGLTVLDEAPLFLDSYRCMETMVGLSIYPQAGNELRDLYVLFLWPPGATVPKDVSALSVGDIAKLAFERQKS